MRTVSAITSGGSVMSIGLKQITLIRVIDII